MQSEFEGVEGLISKVDRLTLQKYSELANYVPGEYVEIGSYLGASTLNILNQMPDDRTLYCFDYWGPRYLQFRENMIRHNKWHKIMPHTGDFRLINRYLTDDLNLSFIFVDNDHSFQSTALPVLYLWPYLNDGGYFLFHDYNHPNYPGVKEFIDLFEEDGCFETQEIAGSVYAIKKTGPLSDLFIASMYYYFKQYVPEEINAFHRSKIANIDIFRPKPGEDTAEIIIKYHNQIKKEKFIEKATFLENKLNALLDEIKSPDNDPYCPKTGALSLWYKTISNLKNDSDIYLYAAGKHTEWLLPWLKELKLCERIRGIIDDSPQTKEVEGIPVITPINNMNNSTIIISSDSCIPNLIERAKVCDPKNIINPYDGKNISKFTKIFVKNYKPQSGGFV